MRPTLSVSRTVGKHNPLPILGRVLIHWFPKLGRGLPGEKGHPSPKRGTSERKKGFAPSPFWGSYTIYSQGIGKKKYARCWTTGQNE